MKNNGVKNIFFPIENIGRELDYKLLIAAKIIKPNMRIVFAQHDLVGKIISKSKIGIYFGKNVVNPVRSKLYEIFNFFFFIIAHLDEEGAIFQGTKSKWKKILKDRLDINRLTNKDIVFTWGEFQKNNYLNELNSKKKINIIATGTPRFDLYRNPYKLLFQVDINKIKKEIIQKKRIH